METPRPKGDRVLNRLIWNRFFSLIISVLVAIVTTNEAKSQITNELYFDAEIRAHLEKTKSNFGILGGFLTDQSKSLVQLDTASRLTFFVEIAALEFEKLEEGYQRTFQLVMEHRLADSAVASFSQQLKDTVAKSALRQVRKTPYSELKGNDPRWAVRVLVPVAIIATGITGIISLFYIRSS
jgi:hypothetical protein